MRLVVLALGIGLLSACAAAAGCDLRNATISDPEPRCQERTGAQGTPLFAAFCDPLGGEGVQGGCPDRDQIVGGCMDASLGGDIIDWYYPPETVESVQATCEADGDEFVDAPES